MMRLGLLALLSGLFLAGCADRNEPLSDDTSLNPVFKSDSVRCFDCHTPSLSPQFLTSVHGKLACTSCHSGNASSGIKDSAHADLVKKPSEQPEANCALCHKDITARHAGSLHATGKGMRAKIEARSGVSMTGNVAMTGRFTQDCGKCHASCGSCHVVTGHRFRLNDAGTCEKCHTRVDEEYSGALPGNRPDIHNVNGATCTECHANIASHGTNDSARTGMFSGTDAARCETCHPPLDTNFDHNTWHDFHWRARYGTPKLACQVCHAQAYANCSQCHAGDSTAATRFVNIKIARNPLKSATRAYDYALVRHVPVTKATFDSWGLSLLHFDSIPTWKYAAPHTIRRWTPQTDSAYTASGGTCSDRCHDSRNYLKEGDFDSTAWGINRDELLANQRILMEN
ncbi:MAG: hypothetical protein V1913_01220 [Fibrobacterota bacterium]